MPVTITNIEKTIDSKVKQGLTFKECEEFIRMSYSDVLKTGACNYLNYKLANGYFEISIRDAEKVRPGIFRNPPKIQLLLNF